MSNLAVIGCGAWGKNLVRNFYELGGLTHISDTNPERLSEMTAQYPGVSSNNDYQALLENSDLSAVVIGKDCVLGQNVNVASRVVIGDRCKIQNNVSLYEGVVLEDEVFCGPSMVFTNVINPRSGIERKSEYKKTLVRKGATIGANATIVCGVTIGRHAFIGAGAVVTGDVPDYALMLGVPAIRKGWMSRHGHRLTEPNSDGLMICPESNWHYREVEPMVLRCLDWPEDRSLSEPPAVAGGQSLISDH